MKTVSASLLCVLLLVEFAPAQERPVAPPPTAAPATAPLPKQDPAVAAIKYDAKTGQPTTRFTDMHEQFVAHAKEGNVDLLFLGDSITQGWGGNGKDVWERHYAKYNVANFGIGGDQTQHVLWRIENGELENIKPKVIVLTIGTNNTAGHDADRIAEGVTKILKTAQAKTGAKVLLLGVFPRGENAEKGAKFREKITRINEVISKLDDGKTVRYLDLKDTFQQPDGTIPKDVMPDSLHLSPKGYAMWAEAMDPLLTEMMGQ
ncbi:MAG: GDSL-type esterase/lipase family protein [Planctomycetota bacterium]|nr:GDSL-type esterase/lipase family protein [Planctomycetota bacterium]